MTKLNACSAHSAHLQTIHVMIHFVVSLIPLLVTYPPEDLEDSHSRTCPVHDTARAAWLAQAVMVNQVLIIPRLFDPIIVKLKCIIWWLLTTSIWLVFIDSLIDYFWWIILILLLIIWRQTINVKQSTNNPKNSWFSWWLFNLFDESNEDIFLYYLIDYLMLKVFNLIYFDYLMLLMIILAW